MTAYEVKTSIEDGIERISYYPAEKKHPTPIVMQHGMWHGAWCWESWQKVLAEQGWESHAHSLPAHSKSPTQRPLRWCTLGYYLDFLSAEVQRHTTNTPPILMGHSMGGALSQWYLKKVADNLPATVLVASWNSHEMMSASLTVGINDPVGMLIGMPTLSASPYVRNPKVTKQVLLSDDSIYSPEDVHAKLDGESMLVTLQHNPPLWQPLKNPRTPILWIIPENDNAVLPRTQKRSAEFYDADVIHVAGAAHNVMMDTNYADIARQIDTWLAKTVTVRA
ncbi:MAG: alpha/beta fold hydrolase [Chloroflexota bacterium]